MLFGTYTPPITPWPARAPKHYTRRRNKDTVPNFLPYALPAVAGLLALLLASAVDRWAERLDAWVDRRFMGPKKVGE